MGMYYGHLSYLCENFRLTLLLLEWSISFSSLFPLCAQPQPCLPLLFIKHDRNVSTSGLAHLLFTLPERVFLQTATWFIYSPLTSLFKCYLITKGFPDHYNENRVFSLPHLSLSAALLCLVFFIVHIITWLYLFIDLFILLGYLYWLSPFLWHICSPCRFPWEQGFGVFCLFL